MVFTHGAGGTLNSPAVSNFAAGFSSESPLLCFQGPMNLPSRVKMFKTVIDHQGKGACALGGRSMGARAAILALSSEEYEEIKALILVSYPLHTGKDVRDQILLDLDEDIVVLFVIGSRDSMCDISRLNKVRKKMKAESWLVTVEEASHGMELAGKAKKGTIDVAKFSGAVVAEWLQEDAAGRKHGHGREGRIWWDQQANDGAGQVMWSGWVKDAQDGNVGDSGKEDAENIEETSRTKRKRRPTKSEENLDTRSEVQGNQSTRSASKVRKTRTKI
ncbi:hypothetical protein UCRPC4_g03293 [Phaeomoniella chlamydospora]|uniref:KANL3/Tex30 alpha/beta hydrolase-like domain-containing protein n=1 Tax=Phaeomoniella chlamydospora TaxID=158046 RepID=A0A0G2GG35_PHACM|nr:hypothetical protein UCRPC4_g03293 [Phaeomoniella chlamydospora]